MFKLVIGSAAALMLAGSAQAAVTFSSTAYDTGVPTGEMIVDDFDHPVAAAYTFTFRDGARTEDSSISGFAASPAGDTSTYAVVPMNSYAYLKSTTDLNSASIYLGSIDTYNYIAFLDNDTPVAAFNGSQLVATPNGDQTSGATNRLFDFNFGGQAVNEIAFGSTGNSFEFDNVAVSAAPEPSTWLLMLAGIGGIGLMMRRARKALGFRFEDALSA